MMFKYRNSVFRFFEEDRFEWVFGGYREDMVVWGKWY